MAEQDIETFLRRVHRRWVLWRVLEHAGIGLVAGCALAIALGATLFLQRQSVIGMAEAMLVVGVVAGLAIGFIRRPTMLDAAIEADRQLNLADLLGTALAIKRGTTARADAIDDDWSRTLLAVAGARCARLTPSELVLRGLGARAWGGIGLSAAMCLTLGLMSASPLVSRARSSNDSVEATRSGSMDRVLRDSTRPRDSIQPGSRDEARADIDASSDIPQQADSAAGSARPSNGRPGADGSGGGESHTGDAAVKAVARSRSSADSAGSSQAGAASAGVGSPATTSVPSESAGGAVSHQPAKPAPPWRSSDWHGAQEGARQAIDRGQVPDAYRDMVRDYFAR